MDPKRKVSLLIKGAAWISGLVGKMIPEMERQKWTDEEIYNLVAGSKPGDQSIERLVAGLKKFPSEIYAPDWIPAGCRVEEDVVVPIQFQMRNLEWVPILEDLEPFIFGETMRERAKAKVADFGLVEAKYIWEHRQDIPTNISVVFTGTLLFDTADSRLKVCHMYWSKGQWFRTYPALMFGWYGHHRLPRIKSS